MNKKMIGLAVMAVVGMVVASFAGEDIDASRGVFGQVNLIGPEPLKINSTNVTVSAAQINAAGGGTTATISPTTVNAGTVTATTVFKVGQVSTGSFTTAMGPLILNQPVGSVSSNIVTKYLLFQVYGSTNWYSVPAFQCSAP